jgi:hypothetical protein
MCCDESDDDTPLGEALRDLAPDDAPGIDAVEAVRELRERG